MAANLGVGLAQQVMILHALGGARTDVVFTAQAPFIVVGALAGSIASNVVLPRIASQRAQATDSITLNSLLVPFSLAALGLSAVTLVIFVLLGDSLFSTRVGGHSQLSTAMAWSALAAVGTGLCALFLAQAMADGESSASTAEAWQLGCGLFGLACNPWAVERWAVTGAAMALAIKPLLAAAILAYVLCRRSANAVSAEGCRKALALLMSSVRLLPTHLLQKSTPLLDRTFLGYAEASVLTTFALAMQVVGVTLSYFDRTITRRTAVAVARRPAAQRPLGWADLGPLIAPVIGVVTAAGVGWMLVRLLTPAAFGAFIDQRLPSVDSFVVFAIGFVAAGAAVQLLATPLYAGNMYAQIASASGIALAVSVVLRGALFLVAGLAGFLVGVVSQHAIAAVLFYRAVRLQKLSAR